MSVPRFEEFLTTKNTFLDCRSPWLEPLVQHARPSSDPTASSTNTADSTASGSAASREASREDTFKRRTRAQRRRQQRKQVKAREEERLVQNGSGQSRVADGDGEEASGPLEVQTEDQPPERLIRQRRSKSHLAEAASSSGPGRAGTAQTKVSL